MNGLLRRAIFVQLVKVDDVQGLTVRRAAGNKTAANALRRVDPKFTLLGGIVGGLMKRALPNKKPVPTGFQSVGVRGDKRGQGQPVLYLVYQAHEAVTLFAGY
jgi:hypothetical protein